MDMPIPEKNCHAPTTLDQTAATIRCWAKVITILGYVGMVIFPLILGIALTSAPHPPKMMPVVIYVGSVGVTFCFSCFILAALMRHAAAIGLAVDEIRQRKE